MAGFISQKFLFFDKSKAFSALSTRDFITGSFSFLLFSRKWCMKSLRLSRNADNLSLPEIKAKCALRSVSLSSFRMSLSNVLRNSVRLEFMSANSIFFKQVIVSTLSRISFDVNSAKGFIHILRKHLEPPTIPI
jgi:hypothetical protein